MPRSSVCQPSSACFSLQCTRWQSSMPDRMASFLTTFFNWNACPGAHHIGGMPPCASGVLAVCWSQEPTAFCALA